MNDIGNLPVPSGSVLVDHRERQRVRESSYPAATGNKWRKQPAQEHWKLISEIIIDDSARPIVLVEWAPHGLGVIALAFRVINWPQKALLWTRCSRTTPEVVRRLKLCTWNMAAASPSSSECGHERRRWLKWLTRQKWQSDLKDNRRSLDNSAFPDSLYETEWFLSSQLF